MKKTIVLSLVLCIFCFALLLTISIPCWAEESEEDLLKKQQEIQDRLQKIKDDKEKAKQSAETQNMLKPRKKVEIGAIGLKPFSEKSGLSDNIGYEGQITFNITKEIGLKTGVGQISYSESMSELSMDMSHLWIEENLILSEEGSSLFSPYLGAGLTYHMLYFTVSGVPSGYTINVTAPPVFGINYRLGVNLNITEDFLIKVEYKKEYATATAELKATDLSDGTSITLTESQKIDQAYICVGLSRKF